MKKLHPLPTIIGILIFKAIYNNEPLTGFLYLTCLIFSLFVIAKLLRLAECLLTGKGDELIYSDLPRHQQIDAVLILNNNRVVNYESGFYNYNDVMFRL